MQIARRRASFRNAVVAFTVAAAAACGARDVPKAEAQGSSTAAQPSTDMPAVLATVAGSPITLTDVRARAGDDLDQLDMQYRRARYQIIRAALDSVLRQRVLVAEAQKRGKTLDELISAEAASAEPTEVDVAAWYTANQARLNGRTLDQLRPQIADLLRQQRRGDALKRLQERLYRERNVSLKLPPFRVALNNAGSPVRGKADAPVTITEFADFQCPYCGAFYGTLQRVEKTFGDSVRVVYRQFPLTSIHPYAFKAAEASLCAHEQGRFWEMHDVLYQEQNKLGVADLKEKATRLGLDSKRFDSCLQTGRAVEQVEKDQKEGMRLGVNGTPSVFINGTPMEGGAVAYETLVDAVRQELARTARR